jgi:hypothetical protein
MIRSFTCEFGDRRLAVMCYLLAAFRGALFLLNGLSSVLE